MYSKHSKIGDVWNNPMGRDVLQLALGAAGRSENALAGRMTRNLRITVLDRFFGKGFAEAFIHALNAHPGGMTQVETDEPTWWKGSVFYHIYMPSFMDTDSDGWGDLGGVRRRLPYLRQLGVDVVWMWPVMDAPMSGPLGTRNHWQVGKTTGTLEEFEALCKEAHAQDMKVIIGSGLSATSNQHPWFRAAIKGDEKYQNYYVMRPGTPDCPPNNWGPAGMPAAWTWHPEIEKWSLNLLGENRPDLNWDNPEVRLEYAEILKYWLQKGADGFMLGAVNYISKQNMEDGDPVWERITGMRGYEKYLFGPKLMPYLKELRERVGNALMVGEPKGFGPAMCKQLTADGRQLDMVVEVTHLALEAGPHRKGGKILLSDLKKHFLKWVDSFGNKGWGPLLLDTSEHPKLLSRLGASPVYRSTVAKLLATMLFTLRGCPVLYQGQELGLVNTQFRSLSEMRHNISQRRYAEYKENMDEPEAFQKVLAAAPDHARIPMPWNSGPYGGFTGGRPWIRVTDGVGHLNAAAQMADKHSVWRHYQALGVLRKKSSALMRGSFNPVFTQNDKVFCYFRILDGEKWYVEMNITERAVGRPGRILPGMQLEMSNYQTQSRMLRPYEANIYRCD